MYLNPAHRAVNPGACGDNMTIGNRWLVLAILSSALFLITVDMTVLYTALPRLTHDLAATASQRLWIVNAYPLVVAGTLLGFGTLGDRLGHKHMFVAGLVVFGLASAIAAFAPTAPVLIGARVLLGLGAAMMMPATLSLVRLTFEDERERAFAIGIWAAIASGGAALGPVLGGVLLEFFWWGSVFLINVPVVIVALACAMPMIANRPGRADRPWDLIGSAQVLVGLVALAYAVKQMATRNAAPLGIVIALALGVAALALFAMRQHRLPHKLVDFALFADPRFASGVVVAIAAAGALVGVELVVSQRLQLVVGLSPLQAGLFILPIPLAAFVAGPVAGLLLPRIGAIGMLWSAMLVAGLGLALYLVLHDTSFWGAMGGFVLFGAGIGAAMTAASSAIMLSAPADRAGMAASIEEVSYELGGAIGIAIMGSILTAIYGASLVLPEGMAVPATVYDSIDEALMAAEQMGGAMADSLIAQARQAFDAAFSFIGAAAAVLLLATGLGILFQHVRQGGSHLAGTTGDQARN